MGSFVSEEESRIPLSRCSPASSTAKRTSAESATPVSPRRPSTAARKSADTPPSCDPRKSSNRQYKKHDNQSLFANFCIPSFTGFFVPADVRSRNCRFEANKQTTDRDYNKLSI